MPKISDKAYQVLDNTGEFSAYGLGDGSKYANHSGNIQAGLEQGGFAKNMLQQVGANLNQTSVVNPTLESEGLKSDVVIAAETEKERAAFGEGAVTISKEQLQKCVDSVEVATAMPTQFYVALQEKGLKLQDKRSAAQILGIELGADMTQYGFTDQKQFEKFCNMTPVMMIVQIAI